MLDVNDFGGYRTKNSDFVNWLINHNESPLDVKEVTQLDDDLSYEGFLPDKTNVIVTKLEKGGFICADAETINGLFDNYSIFLKKALHNQLHNH